MEQQIFYVKKNGYIRITKKDGKVLPFIILEHPIAKQYAGFRLIYKDLKTVKACIDALKETAFNGESSIQKQSLSFYSVVTYGKCFTEANGRGTKLDERDALKFATETQKLEHKKIMSERHDYVAHAGLKGHEQNPVVAVLSIDEPKAIIDIHDNIMNLVDIDSQLVEFEGLVDNVIKYVKEVYNKKMESLKKELSKLDIKVLETDLILPDESQIQTIKSDKK